MGKLVGSCLVAAVSVLYCIQAVEQINRRYVHYNQLFYMLTELKRNNEHERKVLSAVMEQLLYGMEEGELYLCTKEMVAQIRQHLPMELIWNNYVDRLQETLMMPMGTYVQMIGLGKALSHKDSESIRQQLAICLELLGEDMAQQRQHMKEQKRIKIAGSFFVGMISVVLFM